MVTSLFVKTPAREQGYEMTQYVAGRVLALAAGTTVNQKIGTVPAGSLLLGVTTRVVTAITGGTPTLGVGITSGGVEVATGIAVAAGSVNTVPLATLAMPFTADTDIYVQIGGGATAGDVIAVVQFVKPLV